MSKSEYLETFADRLLTPSKVTLKTYTGERLDVVGEMQCNIVYRGKQYLLPIVVANYNANPTLLGKNWLHQIKLQWGEIFSFSSGDLGGAKDQLNDLLSKQSKLFTDNYEGMKGLEAHITMKSDAKPIFVKARRVPYALKEQVELDLSHAHAQLNVDKENQEYLTINTHKGLYFYRKLPYGVKSSQKNISGKNGSDSQGN